MGCENGVSLCECGKGAHVESQAEQLSNDLISMNETTLNGNGQSQTDGRTFYYNGGRLSSGI